LLTTVVKYLTTTFLTKTLRSFAVISNPPFVSSHQRFRGVPWVKSLWQIIQWL